MGDRGMGTVGSCNDGSQKVISRTNVCGHFSSAQPRADGQVNQWASEVRLSAIKSPKPRGTSVPRNVRSAFTLRDMQAVICWQLARSPSRRCDRSPDRSRKNSPGKTLRSQAECRRFRLASPRFLPRRQAVAGSLAASCQAKRPLR